MGRKSSYFQLKLSDNQQLGASSTIYGSFLEGMDERVCVQPPRDTDRVAILWVSAFKNTDICCRVEGQTAKALTFNLLSSGGPNSQNSSSFVSCREKNWFINGILFQFLFTFHILHCPPFNSLHKHKLHIQLRFLKSKSSIYFELVLLLFFVIKLLYKALWAPSELRESCSDVHSISCFL